MNGLLRHAAIAAVLAAVLGQAGAASLVARQTNVFGNFLVGAGPVLDSGSFSEFLTTPSLSYGQAVNDAGAVNGVFNGQPVTGSASFASDASYAFGPLLIVGDGAAQTTGETPFSYVSLAANAQSSIRLTFSLSEPTVITLSGSIASLLGPNVGAALSQASASVSMNGVGSWDTSFHQGGFLATRTVLPGNYEIRGNASSRINGGASYSFEVALAPVPEPAAWALLAMGLPLLLARRRT
jgi:hypothetical protein